MSCHSVCRVSVIIIIWKDDSRIFISMRITKKKLSSNSTFSR